MVLNLLDLTHTPVQEEELARIWVTSFLTEDDPFGVLDAVEFAADTGLGPRAAAAAAWAYFDGRPLDAEHVPGILARFGGAAEAAVGLRGGQVLDALLTNLGEDLPDELLAGLPPDRSWTVVDCLAPVAAAVATGWLPDRADDVWKALAEAEVAAVRTGMPVPVDDLGPLSDRCRADARIRVREIVVTALTSSAGRVFEPMLRLARRHLVDLPAAELAEVATTFVLDWADRPCDYDVARWTGAEVLLDQLRSELRAGISWRPGRAERIGAAWYRFLLPTVGDLEDPLDAALVGAAVAHGTPAERADTIRRRLDTPGADAPGADAPVANTPVANTLVANTLVDRRTVRLAVTVLWAFSPADFEELRHLVDVLPKALVLPETVVARLLTELGADELDPAWLDLAHRLDRRGLLRLRPDLRRTLDQDTRLLTELDGLSRVPLEVLREGGPGLDAYLPRVVRARQAVVADTVFDLDVERVSAVVEGLPKKLRSAVLASLAARLTAGAGPGLALRGLHLLAYPTEQKAVYVEIKDTLLPALRTWHDLRSSSDRKKVANVVRAWGSDGWGPQTYEWLTGSRPRRTRR